MEMIDILGDGARWAFRVLGVVLPLLVWQWVILLGRPARGAWGMMDATVLSGGMLGAGVLPLLIPPMAYGWNAIFAADGVWDLTLAEFHARAWAYLLRAAPALLRGLGTPSAQTLDLWVWTALALVIWLLRLAIGATLRRWRGIRRFLFAEALTFVVSAFGVVYLAPLALWSLNKLNFWMLLLLVVLIQDWRHNEPPIVPRLVSALSGIAIRFRRGPEGIRVVD